MQLIPLSLRPARPGVPRAPRLGAAALLSALALLPGACGEDKVALSVDLRTDFVPGDEFTRVTTEVVPDGQGPVASERGVSAADKAFIEGSRIADFGDLPPGGLRVRVRVLSDKGEPLVERQARLTVSSDYALTMVVTRNCEGIVCPVPAGDPSKSTCNGGQCVKPECLPEQPALCPEPECQSDDQCHPDASCVTAFCRAGTCLFLPDSARCTNDQSCDVTRGCFAKGNGGCQPSSTHESECTGGVDDDCDGKIDCEDPDCDARPCDDQNACTSGETCQKSACSGGSALTCDDGEACTDDACNPQSGCAFTPRNSGPCDDGDACTDGDTCQNGRCSAGAASSCDDKNPCTDDTCDAQGGCLNTPNTAPCDDGNACTDGDTCSEGSCKAGAARQCDDKNPCTDDACDPKTGCTTKPNSEPCDDGTFCNGADTCKEGTCSIHAGQPCKQVCDEAKGVCIGCSVNSDCGPVQYGAWTESFPPGCATTGTRSRPVLTPMCSANTCTNTPSTQTEPITRVTDGQGCGDPGYSAWSDCAGTNNQNECDTDGKKTRKVTSHVCGGGVCTDVVDTESASCFFATAGKKCKDPKVGDWTSCGGFANACDNTGTRTRDKTTFECGGGTCKGTTATETDKCTRADAPNGTGCGSGKYCCGGNCVAKDSDQHCSSCGVSCGSGKCQSIGNGHFSCTCSTDAQCVNDGFGPGATCWSPGGQLYCNCQCTGGGCCAGGADCFKPSGLNYCSY